MGRVKKHDTILGWSTIKSTEKTKHKTEKLYDIARGKENTQSCTHIDTLHTLA